MTVCWRYGRLARIVMGTYKFKMKYGIAREIIELADAQIQPLIQSSTLFVPAPTTRKRTLERGFNQSTLLCQIMSKKYKIPYEELLLKKSGGSHQTGKDRAQRLELGMGDFDIHEEYKKFPSDTHIVIVDDVCTTGTTLQRCAETLSEYGFTDINALVLFRGKPNYSRDRDQSSKSARCT